MKKIIFVLPLLAMMVVGCSNPTNTETPEEKKTVQTPVETPQEPETPSEPEIPETPVVPEEPETPVQPEQPQELEEPAEPETSPASVEDKSPYEYVKPACVNLEDYTYVGDYIFADTMNFAEWKYSNAETEYLLAFEKIARVKNDNPDTRLLRWEHLTTTEANTTKATKYKIYAKTSVVDSTNIPGAILNNILANTWEEIYDGTRLSIIKESATTFTIAGDANPSVLTDYVAY